jgi:hypothetical integral membrane protein (TIGR02206 family)
VKAASARPPGLKRSRPTGRGPQGQDQLKQFSDPHLAALLTMVIGIAASVWGARRHPGPWMRWFSIALAALIFAGWIGEYVADVVLGTWSVQYTLPLQLTDAVSAVSIAALLTRRQLFVELAYFWSYTASLQAVLTPDLAQNFPSVFYFTYFIYHVGAIVAASFLVFGCRLYPRPGAVWRVFWITIAWTAIAGAADVITGGNYMYLASKPVHNSLLNLMGPWPWYVAGGVVLGLALLLLVDGLTRAFGGVPDPGRAREPALR